MLQKFISYQFNSSGDGVRGVAQAASANLEFNQFTPYTLYHPQGTLPVNRTRGWPRYLKRGAATFMPDDERELARAIACCISK